MEFRVQLILACALVAILLFLFMVIIRLVANMQHSLDRLEEIVGRETSWAHQYFNQVAKHKAKVVANKKEKSEPNELLLNLPFLEQLRDDVEKNDSK